MENSSTEDAMNFGERRAPYVRLGVEAHPDGDVEMGEITEVEEAAEVQERDLVREGYRTQGWLTDQVFGVDGGLSTLRPIPSRSSKGSS